MNKLEQIEKEFDEFMVKEYGQWKIGRAEAKQFYRQAFVQLLDEVEDWIPYEVENGVDKKGWNDCARRSRTYMVALRQQYGTSDVLREEEK